MTGWPRSTASARTGGPVRAEGWTGHGGGEEATEGRQGMQGHPGFSAGGGLEGGMNPRSKHQPGLAPRGHGSGSVPSAERSCFPSEQEECVGPGGSPLLWVAGARASGFGRFGESHLQRSHARPFRALRSFSPAGLLCHLSDACISNPCNEGSNCDTNPVTGKAICTCPSGYMGPDCTQDVDECSLGKPSVSILLGGCVFQAGSRRGSEREPAGRASGQLTPGPRGMGGKAG